MVSEPKLEPILARFLGHFVPPEIGPLTNHPLISCSTHKMNIPRREGVCWSPTSTRDKANSQYIIGCNPHLTNRFCGVELDLKLTSNMVSEPS